MAKDLDRDSSIPPQTRQSVSTLVIRDLADENAQLEWAFGQTRYLLGIALDNLRARNRIIRNQENTIHQLREELRGRR